MKRSSASREPGVVLKDNDLRETIYLNEQRRKTLLQQLKEDSQ